MENGSIIVHGSSVFVAISSHEAWSGLLAGLCNIILETRGSLVHTEVIVKLALLMDQHFIP